ncbi:MAG: hypothetical protein WBH40_19305, partial [Ignavibacteriaceae bacterium]
MSNKKISSASFTGSLLFHAVLLSLFMLLNLSFEYEPSEYIELSFGISSETGSSGSKGSQIVMIEEVSKPEVENLTKDKSKDVKEVDLPVAVNTSEENVIKPAEKDKDVSEESSTENNDPDLSSVTSTGQGNLA